MSDGRDLVGAIAGGDYSGAKAILDAGGVRPDEVKRARRLALTLRAHAAALLLAVPARPAARPDRSTVEVRG